MWNNECNLKKKEVKQQIQTIVEEIKMGTEMKNVIKWRQDEKSNNLKQSERCEVKHKINDEQ